MTDTSRPTTRIDQIADAWVDTLAELSPMLATYIGRTEYNDRFDDLSPAGTERSVAAAQATLAELESAEPVDDIDVVTKEDLSRELRLQLELHEAKAHLRDLNVIASPAQDLRQAFDLMPTDTVDDWAVVSARLKALPQAIAGYIETLREGIAEGVVPARRQVHEVITQIGRYTDDNGFFAEFAAEAAPAEGHLPASLARELTDHSNAARVAYESLSSFLSSELAPEASEQDAVGRELYALHSRRFLGAEIDLDETYEWGIEELARMVAEQESIAAQISPGATVEEAVALLEADPARQLHGAEALQRWMQETSDRAVEELGRTHFDIAEPIRRLECMIAPTNEGGIYYTGPTDDFSRPGRMWWSVPEGVDRFDTWRELTTVYHEGVPGHHLQIAQAVYNRAQLNSWRRLLAGTSGHAEGWALYAERLMEQLGYLDDPADRLGMLDGQRMRAARVVLDIGVHLQKPRLDGTGTWDYDYALEFMRRNVNMSDEFVQFEVNRYFGWPGQAPAYKVGQRIWEQLRDEVAEREGENFSIKQFHKRALDIGGVGLDTLRAALRA
ncbi:DUF885 domain-containing protein [Microbacterium sp. zg.Y1090]|uniref:DUF885 domain-containing protein n=1 Tax=Microbacterium TaxID=33882 RepID=UPI00214C3DEE|nr:MULTISPECIES: DUF885 domain-containing protein [unclassified Microbacterium]MCR2811929.1 DUF885 domain-containing protein [Microbacterium sp. zg.Y1084]MCR2818632.1 DUF885 domain-containing protein [Microbacterium sp. zg.Y1090]MDL5486445.1 DUF885 domain-containing protein [Microbacterium sp. zg-Y1211]WIM29631.1 DUF885 domain-containing protein [Microbacterium sp. zg-Y1090]